MNQNLQTLLNTPQNGVLRTYNRALAVLASLPETPTLPEGSQYFKQGFLGLRRKTYFF